MLALFAAGSVGGGLLYGASHPKMSTHRQPLALTTFLTLATAAVKVAHSVLSLGRVLLVADVFLSPTMIVAYFATNGIGGTTRQNASTTWLVTSHNVGAAAGRVFAGILMESAGTNEAILDALCGPAAILAISGGDSRLATTPATDPHPAKGPWRSGDAARGLTDRSLLV